MDRLSNFIIICTMFMVLPTTTSMSLGWCLMWSMRRKTQIADLTSSKYFYCKKYK